MCDMFKFAYTLTKRVHNSRHFGDPWLPVSLKKVTELSGVGEFFCPVYTDLNHPIVMCCHTTCT